VLFGSLDHVWKLSSYVVLGNAANARYQGATLGNLAAESSAAHLQNLVNKWFVGLDRPLAAGSYRPIAGTLFVNGASYQDVRQGTLGDCYLLASLAEAAYRNPATIASMFVVNGDGTYTARFFNNGQAAYVTVDSQLPTDAAGRLVYAGFGSHHANPANELWAPLAEKAYAQINEMGWLRSGMAGSGQNAYAALSGGYIYAALGHVTGRATSRFGSTAGEGGFRVFVSAFNSGQLIGFASRTAPASPTVAPSHAYAVAGYNAATQTVTLFNPWGIQYGLITMNWGQIQANFAYFDRTV
jgi:hypothetical protein